MLFLLPNDGRPVSTRCQLSEHSVLQDAEPQQAQCQTLRTILAPHNSRFRRVEGGWRPRTSAPWLHQALLNSGDGDPPCMEWPDHHTSPHACDRGFPLATRPQQSAVGPTLRPGGAATTMTQSASVRTLCSSSSCRSVSRRRPPRVFTSLWSQQIQQGPRVMREAPETLKELLAAFSLEESRLPRKPRARKLQSHVVDVSEYLPVSAQMAQKTPPPSKQSSPVQALDNPAANEQLPLAQADGCNQESAMPLVPETQEPSVPEIQAHAEPEAQALVTDRLGVPEEIAASTLHRRISERRSISKDQPPQEKTRQRGLPHLRAGLSQFAHEGRLERQASYADMLLRDAEVLKTARMFPQLNHEELHAAAEMFAALDDKLTGFIDPQSLTYLLRRVGRVASPQDICSWLALIPKDSRSGSKESVPTRRSAGSLKCWFEGKDVDFIELTHVMGHVAAAERNWLLEAFPKLVGAGGVCSKTSILAEFREFGIHAAPETLRTCVQELGLEAKQVGPDQISLRTITQLTQLAESCRRIERLRVLECASFTHEEVARFQSSFSAYGRLTESGDVSHEDVVRVLDDLHILKLLHSQRALEGLDGAIAAADINGNGSFSLKEVLHLIRRFFDEQEMAVTLRAHRAQRQAGMSDEDVAGLRQLYDMMGGDAEESFDFDAMTRCVSFCGGTLTSMQSLELEEIFRRHAQPRAEPRAEPRADPRTPRRSSLRVPSAAATDSRRPSKRQPDLVLDFPGLLLVMGQLFERDFAGMVTASQTWMQDA